LKREKSLPLLRAWNAVLIGIFFSFLPQPLLSDSGTPLRITAVQFQVRREYYSSPAAFTAAADELVRKAIREFDPHLIVFPEYTSAFLSLTDVADQLDESVSVEEGIEILRDSGVSIKNLHQFFYEKGGETARLIDAVWGGLAEKYQVYIVGGTYFHAEEKGTVKNSAEAAGEEAAARSRGSLYNRLAVYGPGGDRIYEQDKVYLTEFETELLSLEPGKPEQSSGLPIGETRVVFTICRDTFFDDWDIRHRGADVWIDLKANGAEYNGETRKSFARALPVRIAESKVPQGITVCLVGGFLDLFWEGRSSFLRYAPGNPKVVRKSRTWDRGELLHITLEASPCFPLEDR
jgi:predicted amidohydrolase